jgi:hypothetical protein
MEISTEISYKMLGISKAPILSEWAGLRPGRSSVRLEMERIANAKGDKKVRTFPRNFFNIPLKGLRYSQLWSWWMWSHVELGYKS